VRLLEVRLVAGVPVPLTKVFGEGTLGPGSPVTLVSTVGDVPGRVGDDKGEGYAVRRREILQAAVGDVIPGFGR
jgi:hypothetical protein